MTGKEWTMKLKEYMGTHDGEYLLAETRQKVTVNDLDTSLCEINVEAYLLGEDATGQRMIHLYGVERPIHLVTYVETVAPSS